MIMDKENYTIGEVCNILGAPKPFVRKLINHGAVTGVKRQRNHYRILNPKQLELVRTLYFLNRSGMTIRELKQYACLEQSGKIAECKAILETRRRQQWEQIKDLQENIDVIERKIELWEQVPKA